MCCKQQRCKQHRSALTFLNRLVACSGVAQCKPAFSRALQWILQTHFNVLRLKSHTFAGLKRPTSFSAQLMSPPVCTLCYPLSIYFSRRHRHSSQHRQAMSSLHLSGCLWHRNQYHCNGTSFTYRQISQRSFIR